MLLVKGPPKVLEGASPRKKVKKEDLLCLDKRSQSPSLIGTFNN